MPQRDKGQGTRDRDRRQRTRRKGERKKGEGGRDIALKGQGLSLDVEETDMAHRQMTAYKEKRETPG